MLQSRFVIVIAFILSALFGFAQCPSNEADLANGGTFSGNCTIDVGGSITITGTVVLTSGRLTIEGGDGDLFINSGGSITVQNGAVLDMEDGDITINTGGIMTINSGGTVEVLDNDRDLTVDGGTLTVSGTLSVEDDLGVTDGGVATFTSGSVVTSNDDLEITNNGTLVVENGSTVTIDDEFDIDNSTVTIAGSVSSTGVDDINVSGNSTVTFNDGADINFNDMEYGTGDGQTTVIVNGGNLNLLGEIDFNNGNDDDELIINGGTVDVDNDIELGSTDGTITINSGGTLIAPTIDGDIITDPNDIPSNVIVSGGDIILNGVSLPVVLTFFKAEHSEEFRSALLTWQTSSEIENEGFSIEKSLDGKEFQSIGFVPGKGTTKETYDYSFADQQFAVSCYYRLVQTDFDGTSQASKMVYLSKIQDGLVPIQVFPNPFVDELSIVGLSNELYEVQLIDESGKMLFSHENAVLADIELSLNEHLTRSQPGIYFLVVQNPVFSKTIRVIKN